MAFWGNSSDLVAINGSAELATSSTYRITYPVDSMTPAPSTNIVCKIDLHYDEDACTIDGGDNI